MKIVTRFDSYVVVSSFLYAALKRQVHGFTYHSPYKPNVPRYCVHCSLNGVHLRGSGFQCPILLEVED